MQHTQTPEKYMSRALELARHGLGATRTNPMVGCVIAAADGRIIGESWHRRYGEGHAEVNAVASVRPDDQHLLSEATAYVTLEPCSHYGKTPPCAKLLINKHIPHVVVASVDPFPAVSGRGIRMLRDAGVAVETGLLAREAEQLNAVFMTAHRRQRPFITLKWAQSADAFMDHRRTADRPTAARFSTPLTSAMAHRLRALHGAILVGSGTVIADNPGLDTRLFPGESPVPVILDRRGRLQGTDYKVLTNPNTLILSDYCSLTEAMHGLYERGFTSVLVEGGAQTLRAFIDEGLWDAARVETAPFSLGADGIAKAPSLSTLRPVHTATVGENVISWLTNNDLFTATHPFIEG